MLIYNNILMNNLISNELKEVENAFLEQKENNFYLENKKLLV